MFHALTFIELIVDSLGSQKHTDLGMRTPIIDFAMSDSQAQSPQYFFFLFCWKLWQIRNSLVTTRNKSDQSIREDLGAFSTLRLLLNLKRVGGVDWCHQREVTPWQRISKWWVCHECAQGFLIADCLVEGSWFSKMQDEENAIMYHLKSYFPFLSFYWEGGGGLLLVVMKSWCFKIKINHYCLFFQWSCDGAYTLNMNSTCTEKFKAMILWKMYVLLSINFLEVQNSISGQNPFRGNVWKKKEIQLKALDVAGLEYWLRSFFVCPVFSMWIDFL